MFVVSRLTFCRDLGVTILFMAVAAAGGQKVLCCAIVYCQIYVPNWRRNEDVSEAFLVGGTLELIFVSFYSFHLQKSGRGSGDTSKDNWGRREIHNVSSPSVERACAMIWSQVTLAEVTMIPTTANLIWPQTLLHLQLCTLKLSSKRRLCLLLVRSPVASPLEPLHYSSDQSRLLSVSRCGVLTEH